MDILVPPPRSSTQTSHSAPLRWLLNYLNSGQSGGATLDVHYVNAITLIGTADIIAAVLIEYSIGNSAMAVFMGFITLSALLNVIILRKTLNASLAATVILLIMLIMLTVILVDGMFQNTAPLWYATFPAVAFFFKGKRQGSLWLGALLTILLLLMLAQSLKLLHTPFSNPTLALLFASTLTLGMIVYVYESMRARVEESLQQARAQLHHLAHHDPLTALPNRTAFYDRLQLTLAQIGQQGRHLAVLFIDLDNFKPINDIYGHETGDQLLIQAATRLRGQIRASDFIGRFGGDEFVMILTDISGHHDARIVADKLVHALSAPFNINGHQCRIGVSIGIGLYPDCASTADSLVHLADHAMYTIKARGKNGYALCPFNQEGDDTSPYKGQSTCNRSCPSASGGEASCRPTSA